jgi:tRNA G18 (ribose-2'-O)-methylase SpoU
MTDWYGGLAAVRAAGFRLLALTPDVSAVPVSKVPPGERAALMLGTEGDGLSSRWLHEADEAICIPMDPAARAGRCRLAQRRSRRRDRLPPPDHPQR